MHYLEALTGILISLSFFASIVLSLFFYYRARHKERMLKIEKGYQSPQKPRRDRSAASLKYGIFLVGIGLGIFFGYIIASSTIVNEVVSYFTMILLFGGIALIFNFILEGKINQQKTNG